MSSEDVELDFDQWSELAAMSSVVPRDEFLDALDARDIGIERFEEAEKVHVAAMVAALSRGDRSLAEAHGLRCVAAREAGGTRPAAPPAEGPASARTLDPAEPAAALPFGGSPSPEFSRMLAAPAPRGEAVQSGETVVAEIDRAAATLPFDVGSTIPSVEQYARLSAEVAHDPAQAAAIRERYGLASDRRFAALERLYKKRFEIDPVLKARFERLMAEHLRALRSG